MSVQNEIPISIERAEGAQTPTRGSDGAAGYDLSAYIPDGKLTVAPGARVLVSTGIKIALKHGFYGRIAPRSGLALKYGIDVLAGVIDSDYRGYVKVILLNTGDAPFVVKHGDRIAQIIFEFYSTPIFTVVKDINNTNRGAGGFGSTGV